MTDFDDSDIEEITESGERLPPEMYEEDLPTEILNNPVFNGVKLVDQAEA